MQFSFEQIWIAATYLGFCNLFSSKSKHWKDGVLIWVAATQFWIWVVVVMFHNQIKEKWRTREENGMCLSWKEKWVGEEQRRIWMRKKMELNLDFCFY